MPEALVRFDGTTAREDRQLQEALAAYDVTSEAERIEPLTQFLRSYPDSAWATSLWLNIGLLRYQQGYFSEAMSDWRQAWDSGKSATRPEFKIVADRAVGELLRMHARLGHVEEVQALLSEIEGRPILGSASEMVQGAREGLYLMREEPEIAYLCGPQALRSVLHQLSPLDSALDVLRTAKSGFQGVNLADVGALAREAKMDLVPAYRLGTSDIPVPSVVHWRVNHYAAIVAERDGRYHIKDPTFGDDLWVSAEAIKAESSGYFLVPSQRIGTDWRLATAEEGKTIYGMGTTTSFNQIANRPYDVIQKCANCAGKGMPSYAVHAMLLSLNIQDTPLGYAPPKGPSVEFHLTYNQRDAYQPTTFTYSNVGQKWTHNWLSYVSDSPTTAGASVWLYVAGGGREDYDGYNSGTGQFYAERELGAQLTRVSGSPIRYERRFADGSVHVYGRSDGATSAPRRVFLTEVQDPAGNSLTFAYDGSLRLTSVTDEIGQVTTLTYGDAGNPLRITRVTDPFGRYADLGYDGSGRLDEITDVIGMTSTFAYDGATFITDMTTPYGSTSFEYGESGMVRWLEATDPLGKTERLETRHVATGIDNEEALAPSGITLRNEFLNRRNTFYWDKDAYAIDPTDYTKATIKHWQHESDIDSTTSPILESTKVPGEERVWRTYAGQADSLYTGTRAVPSKVAQVVANGGGGTNPNPTQITQYEYGYYNLPTKITDPIGREHTFEYDTNGLDLLNVKRKNGGSYETLASFTWNSQHLPLTVTDDAGQTTTYTYNASGQLLTATNPLSQVTTYVYDTDGYLQQVENANSEVQQSFTYDSYGRVETVTDSEGYVLTYDYDALDRVTRVTYPDTTYEELTYDKLDIVQSRDREGKITEYTYNAMRHLTQVDEPLPRTLTMEWSPAGRRLALYDGENNPIEWTYDIAGRLTAEIYANSTQKTYGYDLAGRLSTITDPIGQIKTIGYTLDDRPSSYAYTNEINATPDVSFSYDSVHPRLTSMTDGIGTTTWAYGAIGSVGAQQVIREDGPSANNDVVAYTYDALGRRASRRHGATYSGSLSGGETESYAYDSLGRLSTKSNVLGDFTYTYLGETGQLAKRTVAASGSLSTPAMIMSYDTNANDRRLTQIRWAKVPNPTTAADRLQDYNYQRDVLNRLTRVEELTYGSGGTITANHTWDATHDDADRLESFVTVAGSSSGTPTYDYTYDEADNRGVSVLDGVTQTPTHNSLNQIATLNGTTFTYDNSGNLLTDGDFTYKWDAENRLIEAKEPGINGKTFTYQFDGLNRRLRMARSGTGALNHRYLWCDERICETRNVTGGALVNGTWFDDGVLYSGVKILYLRDQLGSIRQFRSRSTSSMATLDYGPYGETIAQAGTNVPTYQYADMYEDLTGLYLTWNRAYNPKTGRWLSRDPIGVAGGVNLYGYVGGNVLGEIDPLGLLTWKPNDTQIRYGMTLGSAVATYPGEPAQEFFKGNLGRTIVEWSIVPACECKDGKARLTNIAVSLTPVIYLQNHYPKAGMADWALRKEEEHVADINGWAKGAESQAAGFELREKSKTFDSVSQCETGVQNGLGSVLRDSIAPVIERSRKRYDRSKRHTWGSGR